MVGRRRVVTGNLRGDREDKGLWGGRKYIDSVFKNDQIYVGYSPDIRQAARSGPL